MTHKVSLPLLLLLHFPHHLRDSLQLGIHQLLLDLLVLEHFVNVLQGGDRGDVSTADTDKSTNIALKDFRALLTRNLCNRCGKIFKILEIFSNDIYVGRKKT